MLVSVFCVDLNCHSINFLFLKEKESSTLSGKGNIDAFVSGDPNAWAATNNPIKGLDWSKLVGLGLNGYNFRSIFGKQGEFVVVEVDTGYIDRTGWYLSSIGDSRSVVGEFSEMFWFW